MGAFRGVVLLLIAVVSASAASGATRYVGPGEAYTTIQSAIDAALAGDTVVVRDGTWMGAGNRDISLKGKAIRVKSENGHQRCIIEAQGAVSGPHRAFLCNTAETASTVIEGFTVRGGYSADNGGGIYCKDSSPTITGNVITANTAANSGGGIYTEGGMALITGNTILVNTAVYGAGITCGAKSKATITGNMIRTNAAAGKLWTAGGGIYVSWRCPSHL